MKFSVTRVNTLFDVLYAHGVFLPPEDAAKARKAGCDFCDPRTQRVRQVFLFACISLEKGSCFTKEGFNKLARLSYQRDLKLYRVTPKLHMLWEISNSCRGLSLSPIATCTWSDEDFIGRVSRVSRSCHGATVSVSTIRKSIGLYTAQLKRTFATEAR